ELDQRVGAAQDQDAVRRPARGAGQPLGQVPQLRADDLPPRPGARAPRLHPLRPPHADRRAPAPRHHARPRLAAHRAAARARRPAALPRPAPLRRPAEGRAIERRPGGRGGGGARRGRGAPRGGRGLRILLPRRLHGRGRGRSAGHGGAAGRVAGQPPDRVHRLRRRADAGGRDLPHADAAHGDRHAHGEGGGAAVDPRAVRPHHRRRDGLLRHAGRHPDRGAGRADRLRGRARHRADGAREAARGLPARRIPPGARHPRHGGEARRDARHPGAGDRPAARAGRRDRGVRAGHGSGRRRAAGPTPAAGRRRRGTRRPRRV
ncbi:MAG: Acetyl-coenzyme A carboxyl transferase beta chain, partial [uncultured Acetobacteraceae bacterium]